MADLAGGVIGLIPPFPLLRSKLVFLKTVFEEIYEIFPSRKL